MLQSFLKGKIAVVGLAVLAASLASAKELVYAGGTSGKLTFNSASELKCIDAEDQTQTVTTWADGSLFSLPSTLTGTLTIQQWFHQSCSGIRFDGTGKLDYYSNEQPATSVGSDGVTFTQPGGLAWGYYHFAPSYSGWASRGPIFKLTADQTWDGQNTSGTATISIGTQGTWVRSYSWSYLTADAAVENLTIKGRLAAFLYSPRNDLSKVNVRVESPAELILPVCTDVITYNNEKFCDPSEGVLHAKSVTFSGDGVRARFGCKTPVAEKTLNKTPVTTTVLDAQSLAPTVTLENGADLMVSNAVFGLDRLFVTGGDSVISGSALTFANAAVELAIDAGATLTLDAQLLTSDVTDVSVTGAGTLILAKGANFKGSIAVSPDATLKLIGTEPVYTPVKGAGQVLVALGNDEEMYLSDGTGLTSAIKVTSGTLLMTAEPACGVTTSGDGAVIYGTAKFVGSEPVENQLIKVSVGETLTVGGDGLKSSSTVWMNGGTLRVVRDSVISAAITQDVTSVYTVDATNIVAEFAGPWRLRTEYLGSFAASSESVAKVYGGDIRVTGGLRTETEKDSFYVYSGTIRFSGTDGYFDGYFGVPDASSTATLWVFDGVTYEACYKSANHAGRTSPTSNVTFYFAPVVAGTVAFVNGGTLKVSTSRVLSFSGKSASNPVTLLVDGGQLLVQNSWGSTQFSNLWPYPKTIVDFRSGTIEFKRPFAVNGSAPFDFRWSGGTFKPSFDGSRRLGDGGVMFSGGSAQSAVSICGPDCVLDLGGVTKNMAVTNWTTAATLTGTPGGRLTVKGLANGVNTVVLKGYDPAGSSLALEDNAQVVIPSVAEPFALGELCVNGTDCSLTGEVVAGTPTVGTMRIGAKGVWPNTVLSGIGSPTFANLTFDDGALWRLEQAADPLALTGTLTFGDTVRYAVTRTAGTGARAFTAATAAGGIVGAPVWEKVEGSRYMPEAKGNDLVFGLYGSLLLIR